MSGNADQDVDTNTSPKAPEVDPNSKPDANTGLSDEDKKHMAIGGAAILGVAGIVKTYQYINKRCSLTKGNAAEQRFWDDLDGITKPLRAFEEKLNKNVNYSKEQLQQMKQELQQIQTLNEAFFLAHKDSKTNSDRITERIDLCTATLAARFSNLQPKQKVVVTV